MVTGKGEVLVIGLEPPCPRCAYLTGLVHDLVGKLNLPCPVRHLSIGNSEAQAIAASRRLKLGTAKDVARLLGLAVDWNEVSRLIGAKPDMAPENASCGCGASLAERWSPALDEILRPCERRAEEAGIMMTPILVVDGVVRHQGSVPDGTRVAQWLRDAFEPQERREREIIEILGSGCKNCDALYDNLLTALKSGGWSAEYDIRKNKDVNCFIQKGVFVTPAMVMNGKVLSAGRVLNPDQIKALIEKRRTAKSGAH
jgi:hypothetical protein